MAAEAAACEANAELARGNRCVSVGHKTAVANSTLLALSRAGVRYLSTRSIGYNHIDVSYAESVGICVGNVAYSPDSVADYTLMLMLIAARHAKSVIPRTDGPDYRLMFDTSSTTMNCAMPANANTTPSGDTMPSLAMPAGGTGRPSSGLSTVGRGDVRLGWGLRRGEQSADGLESLRTSQHSDEVAGLQSQGADAVQHRVAAVDRDDDGAVGHDGLADRPAG